MMEMSDMKCLNICKLLILACLMSMAGVASAGNASDSVPNDKAMALPDGIVRKLADNEALVNSLKNENSALKDLMKESQKELVNKENVTAELQAKIDSLQNVVIKQMRDSIDGFQKDLISMASNFLYIPYERYSIEQIAIPAFESVKNPEYLDKYSNRLTLLKNYEENLKSLIAFLANAEKGLSYGLTSMKEAKAKDNLDALSNSELYKDYQAYDDWKNTYLGRQISLIQKLLGNPSQDTSARLKEIRTKLENSLIEN